MTENSDGGSIVNHVGLATEDLDRAIGFYTAALGFALERRLEIPDSASAPLLAVDAPVGLEVAYMRRGPFVLELMQFRRSTNPGWSKRVFNEPGLTHISVSVGDLEETAELIVAHGGQVVNRHPFAVIVRDPDGQLLELLTLEYRRRVDAEAAKRGR
jgi:catechol 2,3-dioxygenase-like lactoylglutathione lyase family enzyme